MESRSPERKSWTGFLCWLAVLAAEITVLCLLGQAEAVTNETTLAMLALCGGFAAYFWLFAPRKLPTYYDQNRIGSFTDGPLRMNVPGVRFTNRNWPHIVNALRQSLCAAMLLFPLISLVGLHTFPWLGQLLLLAVILSAIFIPPYVIGRKYE